MLRRWFILAMFLVSGLLSVSQTTIPEIDEQTYQLYLNKDWKQLIEVGKDAQKKGIDFYYLNYRIGIAYYSLKRYSQSIPFFKAAFEVNQEDAALAEYLYYAYVLSGNENDAMLFAKDVPESFKTNMKECKPKFWDKIDVFINQSKIQDKSILKESYVESNLLPLDQGVQEISKEYTVFNFGVGHRFHPKLSLYHAYTGLDKRNYFYTRDFDGVMVDEDKQTNQNQYYFGLNYHPAIGVDVKGGFHYLGIKYLEESTETGRGGRQVRVNDYTTNNEMVYFASIGYNLKKVNVELNSSFGNLSGNEQLQEDVTFTYFPFGNLNAYTVTTISHSAEKFNSEIINNWVYYQKLGVGIKEKVWLEPFAMFGNIHDFTQLNASIVYNSRDVLKQSVGCKVIVPVYKSKILINIAYTNSKYESSFLEFQKGELEKKIIYNHNSINGGISWKF